MQTTRAVDPIPSRVVDSDRRSNGEALPQQQLQNRDKPDRDAGQQPDRLDACTKTRRLFQILHQGGSYAHLWTDAGNQSFWFCAASPNVSRFNRQMERVLYREWVRHNVFFSVHPLARVPPHNASGNGNPRYISSQLPYIAAVNALFAEYDGKDHVRLPEYMKHLPRNFTRLSDLEQRKAVRAAQEKTFYAKPERYKERVMAIIQKSELPPSVIIDSGGGYHCYWLLRHTHPVDDANRVDVQTVQHGWVRMMGADPGASDLRRVLRVPGTYNRKAGFGDAPRLVSFIKADFERRYAYNQLEEVTNDWLYENEPQWSNTGWSNTGWSNTGWSNTGWSNTGWSNTGHRSADQPGSVDRRFGQHSLGLAHEAASQTAAGNAGELAGGGLAGGGLAGGRGRVDEESIRRAFNRQHSVVDLLTQHGYQICFTNDSLTRLSRPGRAKSNSSVIVFPSREADGPELSIHFSTNDELYSEEYVHPRSKQIKRRAYDAYSIYTHLEHGGNWRKAFAAARRELAKN